MAALLIAAAGLKAHQLATSPATANYVLDSRGLTVAFIGLEVLLAAWLVSRVAVGAAKVAAIICFLTFLVVSLYQALAGQQSCGCFGAIQVHPWVTVVVDAICLVGLAVWSPPRWKEGDRPRRRAALFGSVAVLLLLGMLIPVFSLRTRVIDQRGVIVGDGGLVVLEPEAWIGGRLPMFAHIVDADHLRRGRWRIVFYHDNCPVCDRLIDEALSGAGTEPTTFVEVPPLEAPPRADSGSLRWTSLTTEYDWFVEAPAVVFTQDGVVTGFERPK